VSELIVFLAGRRVGRLIRKDNGNLQFRYDPNYESAAISQALPVRSDAYPNNVCQAVFGGLLPEGEARETIARNLGASSANLYALLEALGGDCAGALTMLAPDEDLPRSPLARELNEDALDSLLRELPQRPLAADPDEGTRLSLAGAQPKLPVIVDAVRVSLPLNAAAATTHIIKPEPTRFEGLVDNEAFCMDLAHAVGLPVARVHKRATVSGLAYLLVERYDRDLTSDPIGRLHQEDFCQALGRPSERKYQSEGGPTVADAVSLLRGCSARPAHDLITLWRALIFNWLIGNCDAHAKNLSLLYDASVPALAPLYDLVSTAVYPELTTRLAMSIDGARRLEEIDSKAWVVLAGEISYSARFVISETSAMIGRVLEESRKLAASPIHSNSTVEAIAEMIERHAAAAG
jgi:serine/threonine-protein kinase HipA